MTIRVAVVGATGRMGTLVSRLIEESDDFEVTAKLNSADPLSVMLDADVVVDVSVPAASPAVLDFAIENQLNVLVGTSGWSGERIAGVTSKVDAIASAGVIFVPNFSLGSVLASRFAATAAQFFDSIEIVEAHGASKIDSPSGTAVRTAELMSRQRSRASRGIVSAAHTDQRARGQQVAGIPVHSIRLQGIVATQDVLFGGAGEVLTIRHETLSQTAYERGIMLALRALPNAVGVTVGLDALLGLDALPGSEVGTSGASATE
jgi:4-hydroxy-tetrahydrodipicolinate reductase